MLSSWLDWCHRFGEEGLRGGHRPRVHDLSLPKLTLPIWLRLGSQLLHCDVTWFPLPFLHASAFCRAHAEGVGAPCHCLEGGDSAQIIWASSVQRPAYFPICLFIQLFIFISMDSWIFILYIVYGPISHCSDYPRFGPWEPLRLAPVPLDLPHRCVLWALSYSLALQGAPVHLSPYLPQPWN